MGSASRHRSEQRQYDNPESSHARNGQGLEGAWDCMASPKCEASTAPTRPEAMSRRESGRLSDGHAGMTRQEPSRSQQPIVQVAVVGALEEIGSQVVEGLWLLGSEPSDRFGKHAQLGAGKLPASGRQLRETRPPRPGSGGCSSRCRGCESDASRCGFEPRP
jgi:hypothetical protein